MAQIHITLNQEEILQLLTKDRDGAFKLLLQESLNHLLLAESAEQLRAEPYERTEARQDSRNGMRERTLTTRIGKIILTVPRHRNVPFRTMIFDNYTRSEAALIASMAEMVVSGVSTRKISRVVETLCGTTISKSAVSELCKEIGHEVDAFRNRPLTGEYPFLVVDATYFKVREQHRIVSKALLVACGVNEKGLREVLGIQVFDAEAKSTWEEFLRSLRERGLHGVKMITSDAHEGIRYAASKVFPNASWQRCIFHFIRNILDKAPKRYQEGIRMELNEMFACETIEAARERRDAIIEEYRDIAERAMACLDEGFESAMTVMVLPKHLRKYFRTSNHIERLNKELKRRSRVIGIFPNEASLVRLMGAVLIERHEAMQGMRAIYSDTTWEAIKKSDVPGKLLAIAEEQGKLLVAA